MLETEARLLSDDGLAQRIHDCNMELQNRVAVGWPVRRAAKGWNALSYREVRGLRQEARREAWGRGFILIPTVPQNVEEMTSNTVAAAHRVVAERYLSASTWTPKPEHSAPEPKAQESKQSVFQKKVELTERERKILEVIQRGIKGRAYCRELDYADILPPRAGVWREGPRKYVSAYDLDHCWRHRIEDEKAKIRRKAKVVKLASELASE